jgi:hypothetical protein
VNYVESDDDEDDVFKPLSGNGRAAKRRRIAVKEDSDDEFGLDAATQAALEQDDGMSPSPGPTAEKQLRSCSSALQHTLVFAATNHPRPAG